jgi:hypothetical protein
MSFEPLIKVFGIVDEIDDESFFATIYNEEEETDGFIEFKIDWLSDKQREFLYIGLAFSLEIGYETSEDGEEEEKTIIKFFVPIDVDKTVKYKKDKVRKLFKGFNINL